METRWRLHDVVESLFDMCVEMHETGAGYGASDGLLDVAARYAWSLYHDLDFVGRTVLLNPETMQRRAPLDPAEPAFFRCLRTLEEFTAQAREVLTQ